MPTSNTRAGTRKTITKNNVPLRWRKSLDGGGDLGLWRITESETQLRAGLPLGAAEARQLAKIKGEGRRKEFLAARHLLHALSGRAERGALLKDQFGKPRLQDSAYHVSISHTTGLSAAIGHPAPCGIDVQIFVEKIGRIAPRFLHDRERDHDPDLYGQHLVWSAKEAMYKAYGRRELDFRKHLSVELSDLDPQAGRTVGQLRKDGLHIEYELRYWRIDTDYVLVCAGEQKRLVL